MIILIQYLVIIGENMSRKSRAAARAALNNKSRGTSSSSTGPTVIGSAASTGGFVHGDKGGMVTTSPYSGQQRAGQNQLATAGTAGTLAMAQEPWWAQQLGDYGQIQQRGYQGMNEMANNPWSFDPIRQAAESDFQTKTLPSIAERFAGMGTGDSMSSGGFQNALRMGGEDFQKQLAGLGAQYGLQARGMQQNLYGQMGELGGQGGYNTQNLRNNMYGNMMHQGYAPQWDYMMRQASPGGLERMAGQTIQAGGKAAGMYFGGR